MSDLELEHKTKCTHINFEQLKISVVSMENKKYNSMQKLAVHLGLRLYKNTFLYLFIFINIGNNTWSVNRPINTVLNENSQVLNYGNIGKCLILTARIFTITLQKLVKKSFWIFGNRITPEYYCPNLTFLKI